MSNNFAEYWKKRVQSAEFKQNINDLIKQFAEEAFHKPISFYLDIAKESIEKADHVKIRKITASTIKALLKDHTPMMKAHIKEENLSLKDRMENTTIQAWKDYLSEPVDLPPETVRKLVNQPAVRELFTNIIHDSIISFNKKVNPLSGVMGALGLESQIREFILPFMDSVMELATNFITDPKNKGMFQETSVRIFEIAINEKPAKYMDMPYEKMSEKLSTAIEKTLEDEKAAEAARQSALKYIERMREKFGNKTLQAWMDENGIESPIRDLEGWELQLICDNLAGEAITKFMEKEILAYQS